jgi:hypothetical protein
MRMFGMCANENFAKGVVIVNLARFRTLTVLMPRRFDGNMAIRTVADDPE